MEPGAVSWNLARCACGEHMDYRAEKCRRCFLTERRAGAEKYCSGCQSTLPIDQFYRRGNGDICSKCKKCLYLQRKANPNISAIAARSNARPERKAARVARMMERKKTDLQFRVKGTLNAGIRQSIKRRSGRKKATRTTLLLGCTIIEFMAHIERLWLPGMAWKNWGRTRYCWQLDHKRPCASFDLSDPAQQRACFHFTNYQPLWALDNARKGASWTPDGSVQLVCAGNLRSRSASCSTRRWWTIRGRVK